MTATQRPNYVQATLDYVCEHGPLTPARYGTGRAVRSSVTGQVARGAGVSVERAWQILTLLEREGAVRLVMGGPKRIVRAEAVK